MNGSARRLRAASIPVVLTLAAIAVVWATGVFGTSDSIGPDRAIALSLEPFDSCEGVRDYAGEHRDWGDNVLYRAVEDAAPVSASAAGLAGSAEAVGPSATGTNVQEIGIDEPDVAKLSGSTLFVVERDELLIFDVGGIEPVELGALDIRARGASDMLLVGERAIVIGEHYDREGFSPLTTLTEVDVSDPAAPVALSETVLEGDQVSSRLTGETARLVLSSAPDYESARGSDDEPAWLPRATRTDLITGEVTTDPLFGCEAIAHPDRFAGLGLIAVVTLDLSGAMTTTDVDAVMTDGSTVYASASSLYVATAALDPPQGSGIVDRFRSALGGEELTIVPVPPMVEDTTIHRFDTAAAATIYSASGDVDGRIINEWSFSEYEGHLRVATTEGSSWETGAGESESSITVLAESDGRLEQVGKVGGLGPGEEIFGVRFVEDMGYVVTFEQTDPLYTVDLSSPEDPRALGELKIPGYSAYLHPVGEGRLLGIGQAGTATGTLTGAQASLFDVADAASPNRLATLSLSEKDEYGTASAEWDHRAFMFSPERSLAVVPVESYGRDAFSGAVAMEVDPDGELRELGRIEAPAGTIERTFVIGERLVTLARGEVDSHDLEALSVAG